MHAAQDASLYKLAKWNFSMSRKMFHFLTLQYEHRKIAVNIAKVLHQCKSISDCTEFINWKTN
jgi:hypothetical protein